MDSVVHIRYKLEGGEEKSLECPINEIISEFLLINIAKLEELSFSGAVITAAEIDFICPLIPSTLTYLSMSGTGLTSKPMRSLAEKLKNVSLKTLDISNNPIGDESVWMLLELIGKKESFQCLNMRNCSLTGHGLFPLLNTLAVRTFDTLDISENKFGYIGAEYVMSYLKYRPKINKLIIRNCGLSGAEVETILKAQDKAKDIYVDIRENESILKKDVPPNFYVDMHSMV
jgi:Ran GTPase-activating protein (RanGAP) involved in mRNA processing and transport